MNSLTAQPFALRTDGLAVGVDGAIASCGGDMNAAIAALLVLVDHLQAELAERDRQIAALTASVSRGYARRSLGRHTT